MLDFLFFMGLSANLLGMAAAFAGMVYSTYATIRYRAPAIDIAVFASLWFFTSGLVFLLLQSTPNPGV